MLIIHTIRLDIMHVIIFIFYEIVLRGMITLTALKLTNHII